MADRPCLVCGGLPVDPAHLVPRSLGGFDEPACVVPLCRCHGAFDRGELDLLPHLEPRFWPELAHGLLHLGLLGLLGRVTSARWMTADGGEESALARLEAQAAGEGRTRIKYSGCPPVSSLRRWSFRRSGAHLSVPTRRGDEARSTLRRARIATSNRRMYSARTSSSPTGS
jgi:hypothetical protein